MDNPVALTVVVDMAYTLQDAPFGPAYASRCWSVLCRKSIFRFFQALFDLFVT